MAKQVINLGTAPSGAGGDDRRGAWVKAIANFDEIYAALGGNSIPAALPIAKGGTGGTTAAAARTALGLGLVATENILPVAKGGTGATTAAAAKTALGIGDIGVGQVWQAASRSLNTTYTNTTGKPIQIAVFGGPTNGPDIGYQVLVNGASAAIGSYSASAGRYISSGCVIVPPGATYSVTLVGSSGTCPLIQWRELT